MAYKSLSDARAAFDKAMSSGKATASDWGSYYHNTASDSSGSKVTNSGAHYTYNPDGSAYYTDNNGNRTQLSDKRGSAGYVNGEFHGDGNGGHTAVGYDPSYSGVNSAPRELTSDEKAYYDNLVQQAMQQKYGWSAGSVGSTAGNNGYNADLQYALKQSGMTADQYRQDLLNRVGTLRSDGRYVTQAEIDTELNRLGLNNLQTGGQGNLYKTGDTLDVFGDGNLWVFDGTQFVPQGGRGQMGNAMAPTYGNNQYPSFGGNSAAMDYYQQAMAQAEAAQKARLEALMGQIDAQRPGIQSQADDAARQAYINQRLGQQAARENLAASGLANTGISETTNLGLQTAYQQALDSINQNKQSALQGLDQAKVQAQSTGNADIASLQSQYLQQMATMKQEYEQEMYNRWLTEQQLTARQSDADWNKQLAMQQYNYQLQQMQQAQGDSESDRLYKLLNAGVLSPEVLQWAGLNSADDYYNMLRQMQIAQTVPKTSSGRSARQVSSGNSYDGLFADTSGSGSTAAAATQSGGGLFNATYNGKQYQLTADELSTLIRTQQPIDYLSNLLR